MTETCFCCDSRIEASESTDEGVTTRVCERGHMVIEWPDGEMEPV